MRSLLLALLTGLWLSLPSRAAAEQQSVVVVSTIGPKAWAAAQARLTAELRLVGLEIIEIGGRRDVDHELARHASAFHAIASLQVLRDGDAGLIRVWLERGEDEAGGYRHVRVNLRNTEVVSQAVLPVVELVYARSVQRASRRRAQPPHQGVVVNTDPKKKYGAPVVGPPIRYHVRSEMRYAVRAGFGPWFSGAQTTPAISFSGGLRAHWFQYWSLQPELFAHAFRHQSDTLRGVLQLNAFGGRVHALLEPWPRSNVSLGIGPGVGLLWVTTADPFGQATLRSSPLLSARAEIASALAPFVDVLFMVSVGYATAELPSGSLLASGQQMMRPSMDTMLAADWHWQ